MKQNSDKPKGAAKKNTTRLTASKLSPKKIDSILKSKSKPTQSFSHSTIFNQEIIEASPIGTLIYQAESGICVYANPAIAKITGGSVEQLCKQNFRKIKSWKKSGMLSAAEKAIKTSKVQIIEVDSESTFGNNFWVSIVLKTFLNNGEKFLLAHITDISEREIFEKNLKLKEEAISKSISGMGMTDLSGNIIYANEALVKMWGCKSMNDLIGKNLTTVFHGDRIHKTVQALITKGFDSGEDIGKRMDGSLFDVEFSANIVFDDSGKPQCMFGSFIDISERKVSEKTLITEQQNLLEQTVNLQKSEANIRSVFDNSFTGFVLMDTDFKVKSFNTIIQKFLEKEFGTEIVIGKNILNFVTGFLNDKFQVELPETLKGNIFKIESNLCGISGMPHWYHIRLFPSLNLHKNIVGVVLAVSDINERKILENELRQSEEDYRKLFENHSAIKIILEAETGKIFDANYAASKFYGWSREELKNMNIRQINVDKTDEQLHKDLIESHNNSKYNIQVKHQLADGSVKDMEVLGNSVIMGGKKYIHSIIIDNTDRKLAEAKIREHDLEFKKLSDNVPDLLFQFSKRIDGSYFVPIASSGIKNIFGCNPEDVLDDFTPIGKVIHPDDLERVIRDIENSAKNLSYFSCEFRVQIPGKEIQWIYSKSSPEKLDDGTITWYGFNSDITKLKLTEEKILKINRLYEFISQVNYLILRAQSFENLYHEICDIAIIYGKFYMSWIGLVNDINDHVNAVAWAGHEDGYLKNAFIVSSENNPSGNGPTGKTVREGKIFICNDIENDPSMLPWRDNALKRGYQSSISIPIKVREKVFGVFIIYSNEKNFFTNIEEVELLEKVTQNISFALNTLKNIEDRKIAEKNILESEEKYRLLINTMNEGLLSVDNNDVIQYANNRMFQITGYRPSELVGKVAYKIFVDEEKTYFIKEKHNLRLEKKSDTYEIQLRKKNGELIWVSISGTPILDSAGNVVGSIGVHSDISERKAAEKHNKNITDDLIKRNKDLEQFTYIVSHNLRSPVANIKGFNEVLKTVELEQKDKDEMLNGIFTSVSKLDDVIQDLNHILQVKQIINEKKEKISFTELVNDIKFFMGLKIGENEVIIKSDFSEIDEMFTLKSYINSVFYNLISNSIKYRRINEDAVIDISSKKVDNKFFITFRDNGLGIDLVRNSDKIFGLYKRFHSHTEGKGMGLFMVKTQVETLGGKISVKSEVGKGTEFLIEFDL
ncbi:MAG: PAS domain S-box protein [Bacteroidota bacterium]